MNPVARAAELDAADPLAGYRDRFVGAESPIVYLDGNSLGRPLRSAAERLGAFVEDDWGTRLIRGWDESWMDLPFTLGDRIGEVMLGAAPGQCVVADSTSVLLYKAIRAATEHQAERDPERTEIVVDVDNFPTDRYLVEGIAHERGLTLRWLTPSPTVTPELVAASLGPRTAVVVLSQVTYQAGHLADVAAITRAVHDAGALVVWDLCHSVGALPIELDAWDVDLAVGCTYKYLNGGPGSPALLYVARRHQHTLRQPLQGWMGHADPFTMGPGYQPASGMRRFLTGTPPILAMQPLAAMVELVADAGIGAVRAKGVALTDFAVEAADAVLARRGVQVGSPREAQIRGNHVLLTHPRMREVVARLWQREVIPDFRNPEGLRMGLSPLSTSFTEVASGVQAIAEELDALG